MPGDDEFDSLSSSAVPGIDGAPPDGQAPVDAEALQRRSSNRRLASWKDQRDLYLRALADFDNFKRRIERESLARADSARRKLLLRVLDVWTTSSALRHIDRRHASRAARRWRARDRQATQLVARRRGRRPIEVAGKPFDPKIAEAVGTRRTARQAAERRARRSAQGLYYRGRACCGRRK